jgi:glycosyltransferase involved in cell wall biosynthesis
LPWAWSRHAWRKRAYWWLGGRRILGRAAAVLCTDAAEAAAFGALGLSVPRLVVPNGLALPSRWGRRPSRVRAKLGIPDAARVVLMLGRLHAKKRPQIAVEAVGRLEKDGIEVHLVLAGPGDEDTVRTLRARAREAGCADRVHLTGLLDREGVDDVLGGSDVLVMPSEQESENFGMAAAEALAAGVPVVGSAGIPAVETAARHGAGRCVPPEAASVAAAIAEIVRDPARLREMSAAARGVAESEFDVRRNAERLLDAYGVLAGRGDRSVVKP